MPFSEIDELMISAADDVVAQTYSAIEHVLLAIQILNTFYFAWYMSAMCIGLWCIKNEDLDHLTSIDYYYTKFIRTLILQSIGLLKTLNFAGFSIAFISIQFERNIFFHWFCNFWKLAKIPKFTHPSPA